MKMIEVKNSSNVLRFGFKPDEGECCLIGTLRVVFTNKCAYDYDGVPVEKYDALVAAVETNQSVGSLLSTSVVRKVNGQVQYAFKKVDVSEPF